jgi:hypothetical protein
MYACFNYALHIFILSLLNRLKWVLQRTLFILLWYPVISSGSLIGLISLVRSFQFLVQCCIKSVVDWNRNSFGIFGTEIYLLWVQSNTFCICFSFELDDSLQFPNCKRLILKTSSKNNNHKRLSKVTLVAMRILPRTAQETGSTGLSPRKRHEESEAWHCWCQVWQHLLETRQYSLQCPIPSGRGQIRHSGDWGKHPKCLYNRWTRGRIFRRSIMHTIL